ncbi:MAG: HAMP domain-containing protein [Micavibrio aeruginosavorus]|nr:HAMP domain-containing protein [Micavibrio aeruginosavorus]
MRFTIKKILPRTLFGRSLLIMVTPVILVQAISVYIFFDRHWSKMTERLAYALAGEIAVIASRIEGNDNPDYIRELSSMSAQYLGLLVSYEPHAALSERERGFSSDSLVSRKLAAALDEQVRRPFRLVVDADEKWIEVRVALKDGVLSISSPQRRMFSSTGYIFLLWMICSAIILMAIAILFMRNQIRPIRRLAVAAERIGKGRELPANFKAEGAREVRQAAQAFIDMHGRITRQIAQRTAMLAGVSHDLRTPLTRLKLQVAMMPQSPDTEAMKRDIDDMERMLNAYLDFVRGEGGEASVRVDLKDMLERLVADSRRMGTEIALSISGDLNISLRAMAFERCLANIIGNARKYAKNIWLGALREDGEHIVIVVDDDGPGIPEDQFEDVFKPFVRVEKSRNAATGGVGLGLSIAQDIVHSHGGEIWLEKSPRGGLRVCIRLPV